MGIEFRELNETERVQLEKALKRNAEHGTPLRMDVLTTGWIPGEDEITDESVIDAIRSVPCHYAAISLERTGQPKLQFSGECVAEADGERMNGREQNRWHELAIYRTDSGKFVAEVVYRTRWQGELDHADVAVFDDAASAAQWVIAQDPCTHVAGYPAGDAYRGKQDRLLADIRSRYQALVTELLDEEMFVEKL